MWVISFALKSRIKIKCLSICQKINNTILLCYCYSIYYNIIFKSHKGEVLNHRVVTCIPKECFNFQYTILNKNNKNTNVLLNSSL